METQELGALVKAVNAVMKEVSWVQGTGQNKDQGYHYASDADLSLALQPAMVKHGLAMIPCASESSVSDHGKSSRGNQMWRCDLVQTYRLIHKDGGSLTIQVAASGVDNMDKHAAKAMTGALKYALRQTFLIPTGDDAEKPLAPGERHEASEKTLAALRDSLGTVPVQTFKMAVREAWDSLLPEHQAEAAKLRNEAERKAKK